MSRPADTTVTRFGFDWGPMVVERAVADDRAGWILIVRTRDRSKWVEVRMSPKGQRLSVREQEAVS